MRSRRELSYSLFFNFTTMIRSSLYISSDACVIFLFISSICPKLRAVPPVAWYVWHVLPDVWIVFVLLVWQIPVGFLKDLSSALFSLLCMPSHCLILFPKVGAIITHLYLLTTLSFTNYRLHLTFIHWFTRSSGALILLEDEWLAIDWSWTTNNDSTEALVVGTRGRFNESQDNHLPVDSRAISLRSHVKSVGVYIDAILSMAKHIDHSSRSAYLEIRRISWIRHLQTRAATARLMCSFDLSRLDFCISFFIHWYFFWSNAPSPKTSNSHGKSRIFLDFFFFSAKNKQTWEC